MQTGNIDQFNSRKNHYKGIVGIIQSTDILKNSQIAKCVLRQLVTVHS